MIQATDSELLMRFSRHRDQSAFRLLVERHGGLVRSVCRRVLRDEQDVDDASQAAFLVLARDAASIRCRSSVAGWLFKVAHRAAIRAVVERERRREQPLGSEPDTSSDVLANLQQRETFELLVAELNRLPEHYRAPLILVYLEGKSQRDAAEELECSEVVLKGRLARARRLLRERLARRGVGLSVVLAAWAGGSVPAAAAERTVQAALEYSATGTAGPSCSIHSVSLAEGIQPMASLAWTKSTVAVGSLVLAGLLTAAGIGIHQASAQSGTAAAENGSVREIATELALPMQQADPPGEALKVAQPETERANRSVKEWSAAEVAMLPTDLNQRSASEKKIEAALADPRGIAVEFIHQPLREVMDFVARTFDFPFLIEESALADEGLTAGEPISISMAVSGATSLRNLLNLILGPRNLTYIVEDGVLKVTTKAAARQRKDTRVYPIRDLVDSGIEEDSLRRIIREHAKIGEDRAPMVERLDGFLVIRQSLPGHRETANLLKQLRHPEQRSPSERKIEEALTDPRGVHVEFIHQPLREVVEFLGATFDIPIMFEETALDEEGISADEPISRVISGPVPLESALNIILSPFRLNYVIEDDVLKITTETEATSRMETRVYPLRDIVDAGFKIESLERIVIEAANRTGEEGPLVQALDGFLVITQSPIGHRRTAELLQQLSRAAEIHKQQQQ